MFTNNKGAIRQLARKQIYAGNDSIDFVYKILSEFGTGRPDFSAIRFYASELDSEEPPKKRCTYLDDNVHLLEIIKEEWKNAQNGMEARKELAFEE